MTALCTGSFDPITVGHYDYIRRAAAIFDRVVVAVSVNSEKKYMFDLESRVRFVKEAFKAFPNVSVAVDSGWVADLAAEHGADVIVKGVRNGTDLDYEYTIACVNKKTSGVDTFFIPSAPEYCFISSTMVREMIKHGKDYRPYVPEGVRLYGEEAKDV